MSWSRYFQKWCSEPFQQKHFIFIRIRSHDLKDPTYHVSGVLLFQVLERSAWKYFIIVIYTPFSFLETIMKLAVISFSCENKISFDNCMKAF